VNVVYVEVVVDVDVLEFDIAAEVMLIELVLATLVGAACLIGMLKVPTTAAVELELASKSAAKVVEMLVCVVKPLLETVLVVAVAVIVAVPVRLAIVLVIVGIVMPPFVNVVMVKVVVVVLAFKGLVLFPSSFSKELADTRIVELMVMPNLLDSKAEELDKDLLVVEVI